MGASTFQIIHKIPIRKLLSLKISSLSKIMTHVRKQIIMRKSSDVTTKKNHISKSAANRKI